MDAPHLLWGLARTLSSQGLKFPTYKMGLSGPALGRRERGALEPPQHSGMVGVSPLKKLTGWQGCHGGSDQALDAQGAESATQEAAGEGQELGMGVGVGAQVTMGKGETNTQDRNRAALGFGLQSGQPLGLG